MEVRAAAAVAAQHRARRGGGALPPLHQPRHGGPAQEDRHRLHQVLIIMWIIIYPPLPRKHIISPSPALSEERPLALVAWGCRLLMAEVEPDKVKQFIRRRGLQGPEVTIPIKMTGVGSRLLCCRAPWPRRASTGTGCCSWPGRPRAQTVRTLTCVRTGGVGTGREDGGRGDDGYYLDIGHSNDVIIVVQ